MCWERILHMQTPNTLHTYGLTHVLRAPERIYCMLQNANEAQSLKCIVENETNRRSRKSKMLKN